MLDSYITVTKTWYITVRPTVSIAPHSLPPSSFGLITAITSPMLSSSMVANTAASISSTSSASSSSGNPVPSDFQAVTPEWTDHSLAIATLIVIIVLALFLLTLIGYMVFLRFKGECANCSDMKKKLFKWERGELKHITPPPQHYRESFYMDLEKGPGQKKKLYDRESEDLETPKNTTKNETIVEKLDRIKNTDAIRKKLQKLNPKNKKKDLDIQLTEVRSHVGDKFETIELTTPFNNSCFDTSKPYYNRQYSGVSHQGPSSPVKVESITLGSPADNTQFDTSNPYHYRQNSVASAHESSPYIEDDRSSYPPMTYSMHHGENILPRASVLEGAYDMVGDDGGFEQTAVYGTGKNEKSTNMDGTTKKAGEQGKVEEIVDEYQEAAWRARPARQLT